jgi:allantoin racemase
MNGNSNKIWWQGSTALETAPVLKLYTESLKRHAREILMPNLEIDVRGVSRGTFDIHHSYYEHLNNYEMIENLYTAHKKGYGAIAVGCFLDSGVREARTFTDIPVLGLAETSMLVACMLGRRFSIVTFAPGLADKKFPQLIHEYGLSERAAPIGCMTVSLEDLAKAFEEPQPVITEFLSVSEKMVQQGAEVILPGCGMLNMILVNNHLNQLQGGNVPIVDVVGLLLKQAETMITLKRVSNLTVSRSGYYEKPTNLQEIRELYGLK